MAYYVKIFNLQVVLLLYGNTVMFQIYGKNAWVGFNIYVVHILLFKFGLYNWFYMEYCIHGTFHMIENCNWLNPSYLYGDNLISNCEVTSWSNNEWKVDIVHGDVIICQFVSACDWLVWHIFCMLWFMQIVDVLCGMHMGICNAPNA
jgi:hypothetical protein